jgi:hypothetical protein
MDEGMRRSAVGLNGIMYIASRATTAAGAARHLLRVDAATGQSLAPIAFPTVGDAGSFWHFQDVKVDSRGNVLVANLGNIGGNFQVWLLDLETPANSHRLINEALLRVDFFGVWGDVRNGNGVIMASAGATTTVYRWVVTNGVLGTRQDITIPAAVLTNPTAATVPGAAAQVLPVSETDFWVDGANIRPMLLRAPTTGTPSATQVFGWPTAAAWVGAAAGVHENGNGLVEFQMGNDRFLIVNTVRLQDFATTFVFGAFQLYRFNNPNDRSAGLTHMWRFPNAGTGSTTATQNGWHAGVPSVEVNGTVATIYLYSGGSGYGVYTFRMAPPQIRSWDPHPTRPVQEETARPTVRIEFDSPLNQATIANKISVTSEFGNIPGTQTYYQAANGRSVLHFIFEHDLVAQVPYTVTLSAGIEGLHGNAIENDFTFTFTPRPRRTTPVTTLDDFAPIGGGYNAAGNLVGVTGTPTKQNNNTVRTPWNTLGSARIAYQWASTGGTTTRHIRFHRNTVPVSARFTGASNRRHEFYIFGDGSGAIVTALLQPAATEAELATLPTSGTLTGHRSTVDWVGWRRVSVDIRTGPFNFETLGAFTGTQSLQTAPFVQDRGIIVYGTGAAATSTAPSAIYLSRRRIVDVVLTGENTVNGFIQRPSHRIEFRGEGSGVITGSVAAVEQYFIGTEVGNVASGEDVLHRRTVVFTATPDRLWRDGVSHWEINGVKHFYDGGGTESSGMNIRTAFAGGDVTIRQEGNISILTIDNLTTDVEVTAVFAPGITTMLDENPLNSVQLYPNPFNNVLHIAGAANSVLQVFSANGSMVYVQQILDAHETINLGDLPAGVYLLHIERDGQVKTKRVIKQ